MDVASRVLRVRSVVGRSTDLYRGVNVDPATPSRMMRARKRFTNGACTQFCRDDTECPDDMTCAGVLQDNGGKPRETTRCIPLAWQSAD